MQLLQLPSTTRTRSTDHHNDQIESILYGFYVFCATTLLSETAHSNCSLPQTTWPALMDPAKTIKILPHPIPHTGPEQSPLDRTTCSTQLPPLNYRCHTSTGSKQLYVQMHCRLPSARTASGPSPNRLDRAHDTLNFRATSTAHKVRGCYNHLSSDAVLASRIGVPRAAQRKVRVRVCIWLCRLRYSDPGVKGGGNRDGYCCRRCVGVCGSFALGVRWWRMATRLVNRCLKAAY